MRQLRSIWRLLLAIVASAAVLHAAETPLERPSRYFNDFTGRVDRGSGQRLNERLAQYERESSNQLLVAIYPRMLTDSSLEDYCTRMYESWGAGRKDKDNGAVLFVFLEDRKMRIQSGYGLEGSLTDAECFRIIEGVKPFFGAGNYAGGAAFAVEAMMAATQGEYQGTGNTLAEGGSGAAAFWVVVIVILAFFITIIIIARRAMRRGYVYNGRRRYRAPSDTWWHADTWGGGGGWSSGGGGGDFSSWSGGGGSTGGGGASGDW